jgi:hypothetical protein
MIETTKVYMEIYNQMQYKKNMANSWAIRRLIQNKSKDIGID